MSPTADRISSLPKNLIEAILACLPIKDAVRTSILSQGWRYEWSTMPRIIIDSKSFAGFEDTQFVNIVDQILLLHRGPISCFKLSIDICSCTDIDRWILFVSRNGIKRITLNISKGQVYKLPSCLFSCVDLNYLELYKCKLSPPSSFKGFSKLTAMHFENVTVDNNWLEFLISSCPLLKSLKLNNITGCTHLRISLPELKYLEIQSAFEDLQLQINPLLARLSIYLASAPDDSLEGCVIEKVLGALPSIQWLDLVDPTLVYLSTGYIPVCLPVLCPLKHLLIAINFKEKQELLAAFCIFRSSPVMQKLDVQVILDKNNASTSVEGFWEGEDLNCPFSALQVVEVNDFNGFTSELKFIEYILANAPVLERLHIKFEQGVGDVLKIFRELVRFRRSSTKAEIIVSE